MTSVTRNLLWTSGFVALLLCAAPALAEPIPIAEVKRDAPVDFEKDILPIFRRNCLACHSATEAESDLVLETPQSILKGGSAGPAAVAGKGAESLILKLAARQQEPFMPPPDNDVKAKPLTSDELGLIKLWIDQGAKGEVKLAGGPINWQPLPPGVNPIFAAAISPDGQYAAAGRANQIFLYHIPSKRELGRLTDPSLLQRGVYQQPGVADLDLIQSLAFSPDGELLASGGYRTIKLWRKPPRQKKLDLAGLEGPPRSIAVSADGKSAAIGEETGKIKVYDLANGQIAKNLQGHGGPVTGVAFTADGTKLVSGSQDKTFRVWNLADGAQIASVETPAPVNAVAIVTDGTQVATGGADNSLRIWALPTAPPAQDAEAPKPVKEIGGHGGPVNSLVPLAPNGAQVLTGCQDGGIRVIDIASGNAIKQMNHGAPVLAAAIRADGKRIASVGANNSAKLWNGENNQQIAEVKGDFRAAIRVADAQRAANLAKRQVEFAKTDLNEANNRKKAEEENQKKAMEALTAADGEFKKKDEAAKQPQADKEAAEKALAEATTNKAKADEAKKAADEAATKANETLVAANKKKEEATKAANDAAAAATAAATKLAQAKEALAKDAENQTLKDAVVAAEREAADAEAKKKAADEAKVAAEKAAADADAAKKTADTNKQNADKAAADAANAFNQADQKLKQVTPVAQKAVDEKLAAERALAVARRSVDRAAESVKKAADAVPSFEQIVKNFEALAAQRDMEVQTVQKAAQEAEKPLKAVAFSPDGRLVATVGDDQLLHTYDAETGAAVEVFSGQNAALNVVAFAADGSAITAAANHIGAVWDFATEWKLERTIGNPDSSELLVDRVTALDFSPDGKYIASGGGEPSRSGEVKIWEVATGNLVRALKDPHSDTVFGLDFSPDGAQIASCGADRFVKVHNVADGAFVRAFEGHTHHVLGVAWRADGRMMASCGADNAIKVWDTRTGDQLRTIQGFTKEITGIRFVAEGDLVLVSSGDRIVRFANAANGGNVRDFGGSTDFVYAAASSADGKTIIAGGADSVLRVWNENGQPIATFEPPKQPDQTAAK
jgi:WD40 repeat protein